MDGFHLTDRELALLDEVWYVDVDDRVRVSRWWPAASPVARRVPSRSNGAHGRSPEAAATWVADFDEPNARVVAAPRDQADLLVRLG